MLIMDVLLKAEAEKASITITDDEVTKKLEEIASERGTTVEQIKTITTQNGQDFEEVRNDVRKRLLYDKVAALQWEGKTDVTDEEAKAHLKLFVAAFEGLCFSQQTRRHARRLLAPQRGRRGRCAPCAATKEKRSCARDAQGKSAAGRPERSAARSSPVGAPQGTRGAQLPKTQSHVGNYLTIQLAHAPQIPQIQTARQIGRKDRMMVLFVRNSRP